MDELRRQLSILAKENPFNKMMNLEVTELSPGEACIEITVNPNHLNPLGKLHGGVISALADSAMGITIRTLGKVGVTVNLNTNFIAPGNLGDRIVARGKVINEGSKLISAECTITRGEDILARSTGVWFVIQNSN